MTNEFDTLQATPEEQAAVDAFANQIDITNTTMVLQYGAGTQKKMADFSETALEKVKTKDLGEICKGRGKCESNLYSIGVASSTTVKRCCDFGQDV